MHDESDLPVGGAVAKASFDIPRADGSGIAVHTEEGLTDSDGVFNASVPSLGYVTYGAEREGFYETLNLKHEFVESKDGRWEPWNPTLDVPLRRIVNPVAMYARHVRIEVPAIETPVGFDILKSDWVAPNGAGKIADFVFLLSRNVEDRRAHSASLRIDFSNDGDGILSFLGDPLRGSRMLYPHEASIEGYADSSGYGKTHQASISSEPTKITFLEFEAS